MRSRLTLAIVLTVTASMSLSACDTLTNWFDFGKNKPKLQGERISIMAAEQKLTPDPQLANAKVQLPPPMMNHNWPQPGDTPSNKIDHLQAGGTLRTLWTTNAGQGTTDESPLTAPPIVADGVIYVLDAAAHIHSFNAATGAAIWDKSLAPPDSGDPEVGYGGGLAFDDGKLFATTGFGTVRAMDAKTGHDLWTTTAEAPIHSAPVVDGGRVYAITQENRLMVLDENDGHLLWDNQGIAESASIATSTNVAVTGNTVIVPYSSGELNALRTDNGAAYWNQQLTRTGNITALTVINDIAGRPVVDGDAVYAASQSGTVAAINLRTGGRLWTQNVPSIQSPLPVGNYVFLVTTEGQVLCLERNDGRVKWVADLPAFENPGDRTDPIVWTGPLLVSNRLLLFSSTGRAVSINPDTGKVVNEIPIPDGTFIPPVMANGTLYILTNDAQLVALR